MIQLYEVTGGCGLLMSNRNCHGSLTKGIDCILFITSKYFIYHQAYVNGNLFNLNKKKIIKKQIRNKENTIYNINIYNIVYKRDLHIIRANIGRQLIGS